MRNTIEFLIKIIVFAAAFFFILEYIFACEIHNTVGLLSLSSVLVIVIILFWFLGNKKRVICK